MHARVTGTGLHTPPLVQMPATNLEGAPGRLYFSPSAYEFRVPTTLNWSDNSPEQLVGLRNALYTVYLEVLHAGLCARSASGRGASVYWRIYTLIHHEASLSLSIQIFYWGIMT